MPFTAFYRTCSGKLFSVHATNSAHARSILGRGYPGMFFEVPRKVKNAGITEGLREIAQGAVIAFQHSLGFSDADFMHVCDGGMPITSVNSFRKYTAESPVREASSSLVIFLW